MGVWDNPFYSPWSRPPPQQADVLPSDNAAADATAKDDDDCLDGEGSSQGVPGGAGVGTASTEQGSSVVRVTQSSGSTSGGAEARVEERNFKSVDSKLIPPMPTCVPEKWTNRPAQILRFTQFVEAMSSRFLHLPQLTRKKSRKS